MSSIPTGLRPRFAATLSGLYGQAGIQIGSITFYDLPNWAKSLYATGINADDTGPCSDLGQLLSLSLPGDTINLFFVDAIQPTQSQEEILGIDGSIPGPASLGGTVTSGAILNDSDRAAATTRLTGLVVARTRTGDACQSRGSIKRVI
jgi:hypothetical protein